MQTGVGPQRYPYPKEAEIKDGCVGCLTKEQKGALEDIEKKVTSEKLDLEPWTNPPMETRQHLLCRFLRARKFNVNKAFDMLKSDIKWREEEKVVDLRTLTEKEVLGCDPKVLLEGLPMWQQGHDKQGRPVIYKKFGNFEVWKLTEHTSLDHLVRHHLWGMVKYVGQCRQNTKETKKMVETLTIVFDAAGWRLGLMTGDAMRYLKRIAGIDSDHFPERLGNIVVVNAPYILAVAWKIIRTWLDAKTQKKIQIVRGPTEYEPILKGLIDTDQLCEEYGGQAKAKI